MSHNPSASKAGSADHAVAPYSRSATILVAYILALLTLIMVPFLSRFFGLTDTVTGPTLTVGGGSGESEIVLAAGRDRAEVTLKAAGSPHEGVRITASSDGSAALRLNDPTGRSLLSIEVLTDRQPVITVIDPASGSVAWSVTVDGQGKAVVTTNQP
ncbi:MAG: hypothetical protein HRU70_06365 [Phycisphaeraceae bacterium]|nr:MAG: hypothetical protein HRU70_06365 [Phycisphaeraceae bacterium]